MIVRRLKTFSEPSATTKYDITDQYKTMNDAEILASKKRSNTGSYVKAAKRGAVGTALGGTLGAIGGGILGAKAKGIKGLVAGAGAGAAAGAALAAPASALVGVASTHGERETNRFVNKRLDYAQRYARRREQKDWVANNRNREGYSFGNPGAATPGSY